MSAQNTRTVSVKTGTAESCSSAPSAAQWGWQALRRNPRVYAKGRIRHPDHATITLPDWHRVVLNTETETETMRHVAFID